MQTTIRVSNGKIIVFSECSQISINEQFNSILREKIEAF